MKISFVITDMSQGGGMERVTALLSGQFVKRGYDIAIISLIQEHESLAFPLDDKIKLYNLMTGVYNRQQSLIVRFAIQISIFRKLKRYLKIHSTDLFIAQGFLPALMLWMIGHGKWVIVCEHFKYELYRNPLVNKLRKMVYRRLRNVVTLTEKDANKFIKEGVVAKTIPNMLSFPVNNMIPDSVTESHSILCIGRLEYQKGFDLLVKAVSNVRKELSGWVIHIYGEGSQKEYLEQLIKDYNCEDLIELKGYSYNIYYNEYAFSIVPSRFEGFPLVILEFLAKGIPVIAFDCPEGPGILLRDDTGMLVPHENTVELSHAIIKMVEDVEIRTDYARKGLQRAMEYTPEIIMGKWEKLLTDE